MFKNVETWVKTGECVYPMPLSALIAVVNHKSSLTESIHSYLLVQSNHAIRQNRTYSPGNYSISTDENTIQPTIDSRKYNIINSSSQAQESGKASVTE